MDTKSVTVGVCLSPDDQALLMRAARRREVAMSAIVRGLVIDARPYLREMAGESEAAA